jgi:hypothetical protein
LGRLAIRASNIAGFPPPRACLPIAIYLLSGNNKYPLESLCRVNLPPGLIAYSEPNGATVMNRKRQFLTETL